MFHNHSTPITVNEFKRAANRLYRSTYKVFPMDGEHGIVARLSHMTGDYSAPWHIFISADGERFFIARRDGREYKWLDRVLVEMVREERESDIPFTRVQEQEAA